MKKRVDILLAEKGLTKSREKAKIQIISGNVYANGKQVKNPSDTLDEDATIELRADACPYVSRGGLKLEKALQEFRINLEGKTCADIGASTGGFTDCMLKNGAVFVYAIDVGYGQFDWSLRNDGRVMLMERTNARHLEALEQAVDFTSVDVSFISLKHIFPAVARISEAHAEVVTLIKPQFEAGKGQVGKKGVVRDPKVHTEVIENVISYAEANGFRLKNLSFSPIKGPSGNIEYLAYFCTSTEADISAVSSGVINDVVENAFVSL